MEVSSKYAIIGLARRKGKVGFKRLGVKDPPITYNHILLTFPV